MLTYKIIKPIPYTDYAVGSVLVVHNGGSAYDELGEAKVHMWVLYQTKTSKRKLITLNSEEFEKTYSKYVEKQSVTYEEFKKSNKRIFTE